MATPCNSELVVSKEKNLFHIRCNGAEDHQPCNINCLIETWAFTYLKKHGKLLPAKTTRNILEGFVLHFVQWQWFEFQKAVTKREIREAFPGMGGDILNRCLEGLTTGNLIAVGANDAFVPVAVENKP